MPDARLFPKVVFALGLFAAAGMAVSGYMLMKSRSAAPQTPGDPASNPRAPDPGLENLTFPAFSLVDQAGAPVTEASLRGRVTIAAFIFTNCRLICPGMSARMVQLQNDLAGAPVRLLSLSVDGEHDTPEVLRAYAARIGADLARWTFVADQNQRTWAMLREIGFEVSEREGEGIELADGTRMNDINHPTKLMLIDEEGRIIGLYTYSDAEAMTALTSRVKSLTSP